MTREGAAELLPRVGDKLKKTPTVLAERGEVVGEDKQECEVIEVNRRGLWYRVRFKSGATECYRVPEDTSTEKPRAAKTGRRTR